jgi:hypothetical protein
MCSNRPTSTTEHELSSPPCHPDRCGTHGASYRKTRKTVPYQSHPAVAFIRSQPLLFSRQGIVVEKSLGPPQRRKGPYYYLRFRQDGRHRSIYLGPAGPRIDEVRALLDQLQNARRDRLARQEYRRSMMAQLRANNKTLDAHLRAIGLHLKGSEVRGWRKLRLPR